MQVVILQRCCDMGAFDDIYGSVTKMTYADPKIVQGAGAPKVETMHAGVPADGGGQTGHAPSGGRVRSSVTQTERVSVGRDRYPRDYESPAPSSFVSHEKQDGDLTYTELFKKYFPHKLETPEEQVRREKKEKRDKIFSAIGDGISALSNLFFTTQYAPSSYKASQGMSARTKARLDKLKAEREANQKAYYDGYVHSRVLDEQNKRDERNWQHTLEREKVSDERYQEQAERDRKMADLNEQLKGHQITAAEYKAEQERIAAEYAEDTEKLNQDRIKADIKRKEAAAGASNAAAGVSNAKAENIRKGNGSGSGNNERTLSIEGVTHRYKNADDYERDVEKYAKKYGISQYMAYPDGKDKYNKQKWTTRRKPTAQIAAEVEEKAKKGEFSEYEVGASDDFTKYEKK